MKDDTVFSSSLPDEQSGASFYPIAIDQVGIRSVRYPITLLDRDGYEFQTIGTFAMYVSLSSAERGTHMSRFIEFLEALGSIGTHNFPELFPEIIRRFNTSYAKISVDFPFCVKKTSPVSHVQSFMDYNVQIDFAQIKGEDSAEYYLTVHIPVTSVCPCSKMISRYGAHNQRSLVSVQVSFHNLVWIRDIIDHVEAQASSQVYSLLKRADEKYVTEYGYENPKFVEDLVRDIARSISADSRISYFKIEAENFESIHNHSAYACIEKNR